MRLRDPEVPLASTIARYVLEAVGCFKQALPRTFIPTGRLGSPCSTAVVDRSGRGGTRKVKATFEEVAARYAERGHTVSWPVSAEIVSMAIMGATKSKDSAHTLFVSVRAVESGLLDGLIAHEMGHMLRTESGHPSHSAEVFRALSREVRIPRAAKARSVRHSTTSKTFTPTTSRSSSSRRTGTTARTSSSRGGSRATRRCAAGTAGRTSASRQTNGFRPRQSRPPTVDSRKTIRCGIERARSTARPVWKSSAPSRTSTRICRKIQRRTRSWVK